MQALQKGVNDIEGHPPRHFWINGANIHIIDFQLTLWSCTELHWVPCLALCSWPWYMPRHPLQISSMLEQWLLLPRRTVQKLHMQNEKNKNYATTLGQALSCMPRCLFHLKATLSFHCHPRTPHCEQYARKSVSREAQGAQGARGWRGGTVL